MDPITAYLNFATALLNFFTEALDGASPEQKRQMVQWYIEDVSFWRALLKFDRK